MKEFVESYQLMGECVTETQIRRGKTMRFLAQGMRCQRCGGGYFLLLIEHAGHFVSCVTVAKLCCSSITSASLALLSSTWCGRDLHFQHKWTTNQTNDVLVSMPAVQLRNQQHEVAPLVQLQTRLISCNFFTIKAFHYLVILKILL